ncbi:hypothetical protein FRX31_012956 [Thalictrum thalictroides]|uniref:RNase H type-1 domain-containing protein n=1 Tax=Thalictrum thalictroides TaxID=46969 RepID=A0A7J6WKM0_THATH|nr:hypothetical protein FRX31_012956 [Thalictrum thalictroides]
MKINTDAASKGNPEPSGLGVVVRDNTAVHSAVCQGLDQIFMLGYFDGSRMSRLAGSEAHLIWLESDSSTAVHVFGRNSMPWEICSPERRTPCKLLQI